MSLLKRLAGARGFTLIEVIVVLAISGILGVGAATATAQVMQQGSRNNDYTTASRHTMNAIYWISRDTQMAQTLSPSGGSGFPVTLGWVEWDNSRHQVTYAITDNSLRRNYLIDGAVARDMWIADYIIPDEDETYFEVSANTVTIQVTSTVGSGARAVTVSKVREIVPRPGL